MKKAAVLGSPISHSFSPRLHHYWLEKHQLEGNYEAIDTPKHMLAERLAMLKEAGYKGVNLTLPLKQAVIPLLDNLSETAQKIGAVNLVTFKQGEMNGDNTDAYGFIQNVKSHPSWSDKSLTHAVILGAGGASRAVIAGLQHAGAKQISLLNRTHEKAKQLTEEFSVVTALPWEKRSEALSEASLLANCTSLGMMGENPLDLSIDKLPVNALVTDIVYNPLETILLRKAKERGNPVVDGLGMLIHQAVPAFEAFYGIKVEADEKLRHGLITTKL